jgi:hypothetical protein
MSSQIHPRRFVALALGGVAALAVVVVAVLLLRGGGSTATTDAGASAAAGTGAPAASTAGSRARTHTGGHHRTTTHAAAGPTLLASRSTAGLVADPEAAQSSPLPAGSPTHAAAISPHQAALATTVSPGAQTDAQIRAELQQMSAAVKAAEAAAKPGTISAAGTVNPPATGPAVIARVIAGANAIADFPYVFGGGHASFVDTAYDCSGSVSYALAAGGMLTAPITSGDLESWGAPGPGRYLTVFANAGHTFMYVDGLRYDTSGRSGVFGTRWQTAPRSLGGFVVRHWPGL